MYEYHVGGMLVFCECLVHQPAAEKMGMVCVQPEGDGNDDFKRVNIRVQPVFKLNVAAYLVVAQYVRFEALMAAFTAGTPVWNSPAISPVVIHTSLPVTLTALSSMIIMSRFMASLF